MLEGFHVEDILLHMLNALVLFLIVGKLLYKPVRAFLRTRAEGVAASLAQAQEAHGQAEALKDVYETRITQAEDTARQRALQITSDANDSAKQMMESARDEAKELLRKAGIRAKEEHDKLLEGMDEEVAELAFGIAAQVLRREARNEDTLALAKELLHKAVNDA
jgi:F-type H+-transporting ATPase subunit b